MVPEGTGTDNIVILTRNSRSSYSANSSDVLYLDYQPPEVPFAATGDCVRANRGAVQT